MDWVTLLTFIPSTLAILAWVLVLRSNRKTAKMELGALSVATALAFWAFSLYVRMKMHPEYAQLPPWKDPVNLDAGLLGLVAPIAVLLGVIAAIRRAPWWLVVLIELVSLPLALVGCAAASSV